MSSDVPVVDVRHVSKHFRMYDRPVDRLLQMIFPRRAASHQPFIALDDVSFQVGRGETMGIIGRNGSGKSTLLQIVSGTLSPTLGDVRVQGRVAAILELGAGFNPDFTGRENVYLNATLLGLSRAQVDERFDSIAAFADIGEFIEQPVKTFSSGMFMRLAFAVIAHVDADVLVIDEALAVGDAFFVQKCMRFLRRFRETGTVLFVSHDAGAVKNLCQRAVWLDHGKLRMLGDAKRVSEAYFSSEYGEVPDPADTDQGDDAPDGRRGTGAAALPESRPAAPGGVATGRRGEPVVDPRRERIDRSTLRNDLEVFRFDPAAASFGAGGARLVGVEILDRDGKPVHWVVGGEEVSLRLRVRSHQRLVSPILGFGVKDRLGQHLWGENSYLATHDRPLVVEPGRLLEGRFTFQMPILPAGDYTIDVAVAEGTQHDHVQHHWLHDALAFRSHSSSVSTGLVGLPMLEIRIEDLGVAEDVKPA